MWVRIYPAPAGESRGRKHLALAAVVLLLDGGSQLPKGLGVNECKQQRADPVFAGEDGSRWKLGKWIYEAT